MIYYSINMNDYQIKKDLIDISESLKERINWALTKPAKPSKSDGKIEDQRKKAEREEREWGNKMNGQTNNGQWTTKLGEQLVYDVLEVLDKNPRKVKSMEGFQPDWETDTHMYEVKTSNWHVSGTAGEKVLGTFIKYQNIPKLYGKPLRIVCVAFQEHELEYGKTKYFGEDVTDKTKQLLDIAKTWGIEYIRFSDLIEGLNYK